MDISVALLAQVLATYMILPSFSYRMDIDPDVLTEKLEDYVKFLLKSDEMQTYVYNQEFREVGTQQKDFLKDLVGNLEREFDKRVRAVRHLKEAVKVAYFSQYPTNPRCCELDESMVKFNPKFKRKVNENITCDFIASSAAPDPILLQELFTYFAADNFNREPSLKWQYFGSEQGTTAMHPAPIADECGSFDSRTRTWYVQASVPQPKEVVIVIDSSGSMAEKFNDIVLMVIAKEAARILISTLNAYDKFAVLAASDSQKTLGNFSDYGVCFATTLAQATPQNKQEILKFVDAIEARGGTYYVDALIQAFDFFKRSNESNPSTERVIHIITDGKPNDPPEKILATLSKKHKELKNTVRIITYGLGKTDFTVLREVVANSTGENKQGDFIEVEHIHQLRNQLHKLIATSSNISDEPVWTVPYLDQLGLGQLITTSLPVYLFDELVGVVGVDMTLQDLLQRREYTPPNEFTYSFLIDNTGLIFKHPLFRYVEDRDSLFVSATAFEREPAFQEVFESMKRGQSGNKTFDTTQVLTQGNSTRYGVLSQRVTATYMWEKIPDTPFSVCVVSTSSIHTVITTESFPPKGTTRYHRLDLIPPPVACNHLNTFAVIENTSVFLSPGAYNDPAKYLSHVFTKSEVESIIDYLEGGPFVESFDDEVVENGEDIFKSQIREEATVTGYVEQLWTQKDENTILQEDIAWRYMSTKQGVYRIFPGTHIAADFNPVIRPWFQQSIANRQKSKYTITSPYPDATTGLGVVTIATVLLKRSKDTSAEASSSEEEKYVYEAWAVMGMDLILPHFNNIFLDTYPVCKSTESYRCYLLDNAGFVIAVNHVDASTKSVTKLHERYNWELHISELEPEILSFLIQKGVFERVSCSNIEAGSFQRTYTIVDTNETYWFEFENSFYDVFDFKLIKVKETNSYILIRVLSIGTCRRTPFSCPCGHDGNCRTLFADEASCECPCGSVNPFYEPCRNEYLISENRSLPCTPDFTTTSTATLPEYDLTGLSECYPLAYVQEEEEDVISANLILAITTLVALLLLLLILFLCIRRGKRKEKEATSKSFLDTILEQFDLDDSNHSFTERWYLTRTYFSWLFPGSSSVLSIDDDEEFTLAEDNAAIKLRKGSRKTTQLEHRHMIHQAKRDSMFPKLLYQINKKRPTHFLHNYEDPDLELGLPASANIPARVRGVKILPKKNQMGFAADLQTKQEQEEAPTSVPSETESISPPILSRSIQDRLSTFMAPRTIILPPASDSALFDQLGEDYDFTENRKRKSRVGFHKQVEIEMKGPSSSSDQADERDS